MTASELRHLDETNYQYITALNAIATELILHGDVLSRTTVEKNNYIFLVKNNNVLYKLHMYRNHTCKSITWEKEG